MAAEVAEDIRYQADPFRMMVAQRLALVGRRHARHAVDQRWVGKPIGPHALVFLYADPQDQPIAGGFHIGSRLFLAGPEVDHLPTVLAQLLQRAMEYAQGPGFDPREQLCNRVEAMHPEASYVGMGVSTLYPRSVDEQLRRDNSARYERSGYARPAVSIEADVPFRALGLLADQTHLTVRCAGGLTEPLDVASTHTLGTARSAAAQSWRWSATPGSDDPDPATTREAWLRMNEIHAFILDNAPQGYYRRRHRRGRRLPGQSVGAPSFPTA